MNDAIRWALARDLEGMREACPQCARGEPGRFYTKTGEMAHCPGYQPLPLANGEIDVGRLIKAIEAAGGVVEYAVSPRGKHWHVWPHGLKAVDGKGFYAQDPALAIAYLKARQDWLPKEEKDA